MITTSQITWILFTGILLFIVTMKYLGSRKKETVMPMPDGTKNDGKKDEPVKKEVGWFEKYFVRNETTLILLGIYAGLQITIFSIFPKLWSTYRESNIFEISEIVVFATLWLYTKEGYKKLAVAILVLLITLGLHSNGPELKKIFNKHKGPHGHGHHTTSAKQGRKSVVQQKEFAVYAYQDEWVVFRIPDEYYTYSLDMVRDSDYNKSVPGNATRLIWIAFDGDIANAQPSGQLSSGQMVSPNIKKDVRNVYFYSPDKPTYMKIILSKGKKHGGFS